MLEKNIYLKDIVTINGEYVFSFEMIDEEVAEEMDEIYIDEEKL